MMQNSAPRYFDTDPCSEALGSRRSDATMTPKGSPVPPRALGSKMDAAPLRERGDPKRVNQTCTEVLLRRVRATDLELGEALTHGDQNPGGGGGKSGLRIRNSATQSPTLII